MKRILFCWQLGANYGHLGQDLPVAQVLHQRGDEISFALPDVRLAAKRLTPLGIRYVMAPILVPTPAPPFRLGNLAEILLTVGFADELTLLGLIEAWRRIFELVQPDAIVLDYAPMALLAARIAKVPALQLTTGFDVPPNVTPMPAMLPPEAAPAVRLAAAEVLVAKRIRAVLAADTAQPVSSLQELVGSVPTLFTNFPELDHYGPRDDAAYIGPIFADIPGSSVEWPRCSRQRVFAYLRPSLPGVRALLDALAAANVAVVCAMPGASRALVEVYESDTFKLFRHAVPLGALLGSADLVVSYGGVGTTAAALLAGVPLLIAPELVEQQLTGVRVEELGAGQMVLGDRSQAAFSQKLLSLLEQATFQKAATAFAQQHASYRVPQAVGRVVEAIDALFTSAVQPGECPLPVAPAPGLGCGKTISFPNE